MAPLKPALLVVFVVVAVISGESYHHSTTGACAVGAWVGACVRRALVGTSVGILVGACVRRALVGTPVGIFVGESVGAEVASQ